MGNNIKIYCGEINYTFHGSDPVL